MSGGDAFALGREALEAGRHAIALEHFTEAAGDAPNEAERLASMAHAAHINLILERPYEAIVWTERLREESPSPDQANLLEAIADVRVDDAEAALALLDVVKSPDTEHFTYERSLPQLVRTEALTALGRVDEANAALLAAIDDEPDAPVVWRTVARLAESGFDLGAATDRLPHDALTNAVAGLLDAPVAGAERVLDTLWARWPGDKTLLAAMATIGNRLPVPRALEWSGRLRAAGLANECPLLGVAASDDRAARERVRAAAAAAATFGDERARALLELAATGVADGELGETLEEVFALAPDLADSFVVAAASTGRRALRVAAALEEAGTVEPAVAVARHGMELTTGQPDEWRRAVVESLDDQALQRLADHAREVGADDVATALRQVGV